MRETRRIVCVNDEQDRGTAVQDGPTPDVRTDPARGFFESLGAPAASTYTPEQPYMRAISSHAGA